MDPYVVTQLLRYTGPVLIPSLGREVSADDALPFLLRDQYIVDVPDDAARRRAGRGGDVGVRRPHRRALPDPIELARDLGPLDRGAPAARVERPPRRAGDDRGRSASAARSRRSTAPTGGRSRCPTPAAARSTRSSTRRAGYDVDAPTRTPASRPAPSRIELDRTTAPAEGLPQLRHRQPRRPAGRHEQRCGCRSTAPSAWTASPSTGPRSASRPAPRTAGTCTACASTSRPASTATIEATLSGTVADPSAELVTWVQPMERDIQQLD